MKTIESVCIYDNPGDIVRDYSDEKFSDEIMDYLDHINDFEPIRFLVLNNNTVISFDHLCNCTIGQDSMENFILECIENAKEWCEDD